MEVIGRDLMILSMVYDRQRDGIIYFPVIARRTPETVKVVMG
jgi:hypothetical protein